VSLHVHHLARVDSTNDELVRRWEDGAPDATVVIATCQERGRGRHGRSWITGESGDVIMSYLHRSRLPMGALSGLTLDVAVVVAEAVNGVLQGAGVALRPRVKWPNDVWVDGRKIAGVLCELHVSEEVASVVIGVGVNVNLAPSALPATVRETAVSLAMLTGRSGDADALALTIAQGLHRRVGAYEARGRPDLDAYHQWFGFLGACVSFDDGRVSGIVRGVDADGALRVERSDGDGTVTVRGGVVHWHNPVGENQS
jgi:BirA family biotin operon repressor/biotin-[acetyl-CoA-carboxylase] ligase